MDLAAAGFWLSSGGAGRIGGSLTSVGPLLEGGRVLGTGGGVGIGTGTGGGVAATDLGMTILSGSPKKSMAPSATEALSPTARTKEDSFVIGERKMALKRDSAKAWIGNKFVCQKISAGGG